ncbi:protein-L-isoaspartate O-methyltransferase family protein [Kordiimonas pumila]|uniref:Protein-L-isoaspartate O-methyltransferase n=1 Tax=Kordiimonas pumila TaxID=2161677 RepID=A0ABV7D3X9_9PROT|nr:protein-L-isoaspartate O-methyltransferase [Kordiimonas pumila]
MSDFQAARTHMIDCQLRPNEVNDERIIQAINSIPRENFVPKSKRAIAYVDEDLEVVKGRYLMEPVIFARLLVVANIQPTDLVLDVGCVTGYSTAVMAALADAVVAVEQDEKLASMAEEKLSGLEIMNVAVVTGTLSEGVAKQGPYDVIFIEGAVEDVPSKLVKQLKEGGRLVCVKMFGGVGRGHVIEMKNGEPAVRNLFDANVQQLPGFSLKKEFVF